MSKEVVTETGKGIGLLWKIVPLAFTVLAFLVVASNYFISGGVPFAIRLSTYINYSLNFSVLVALIMIWRIHLKSVMTRTKTWVESTAYIVSFVTLVLIAVINGLGGEYYVFAFTNVNNAGFAAVMIASGFAFVTACIRSMLPRDWPRAMFVVTTIACLIGMAPLTRSIIPVLGSLSDSIIRYNATPNNDAWGYWTRLAHLFLLYKILTGNEKLQLR